MLNLICLLLLNPYQEPSHRFDEVLPCTLNGSTLEAFEAVWKSASKPLKFAVCKSIDDYTFLFKRSDACIVVTVIPKDPFNIPKKYESKPWEYAISISCYYDPLKKRIVRSEPADY